MKISLRRGRGALDLSVPDDKILDVITGRKVPPLDADRAAKIIETGIRETAPADIRTRKIADQTRKPIGRDVGMGSQGDDNRHLRFRHPEVH